MWWILNAAVLDVTHINISSVISVRIKIVTEIQKIVFVSSRWFFQASELQKLRGLCVIVVIGNLRRISYWTIVVVRHIVNCWFVTRCVLLVLFQHFFQAIRWEMTRNLIEIYFHLFESVESRDVRVCVTCITGSLIIVEFNLLRASGCSICASIEQRRSLIIIFNFRSISK